MNINSNTICKRFLISAVFTCLFFMAGAFFAVNAGGGSTLYFDPNGATVQKGKDFDVTIKIDTAENVFGTDATVTFPSNDLSVKSVANTGYFTDLVYAQAEGRLEIHGYMSAAFASKTGAGDVAKITFTTKKDSGTGAVSFVCTSSGETKIINTDGENVLNCGNINQVNLTFTGDNGLPPGYSEPNQCGGTCGSNYNCKAPLFCYNNFCRSTDCPNDLTCGCKATPTPVPSKKPAPKSTPKGGNATPEVVVLSEFTPLPLSTPVVGGSPEPTGQEITKGVDLKKAGIIAGAAILGMAILLILISMGKKKNLPPKISPPTQGPTPTMPTSNFPPPPFPPPSGNPPV